MAGKQRQNAGADGKRKVLIVDDHPIFRQGLTDLVNQEKDLVVCGHADNAALAMQTAMKLKPDMAIVDISLKETSGFELIKNMKARYPHMPILIVSLHDESLYAERALRAGATGYVTKREATAEVVKAIRKVLEGQVYVSAAVAERMFRRLVTGTAAKGASPQECLSARELEVFRLIGRGYGTRQIAENLNLSAKTIETYRANIKEKLSFENALELVKYAIQWAAAEDAD
ncbi:MAG: response regulator transcription factor [Phycisphaerales bacterium]|nr:MAG: response regulator transcription factor [Phycisphaerales bacterium]